MCFVLVGRKIMPLPYFAMQNPPSPEGDGFLEAPLKGYDCFLGSLWERQGCVRFSREKGTA